MMSLSISTPFTLTSTFFATSHQLPSIFSHTHLLIWLTSPLPHHCTLYPLIPSNSNFLFHRFLYFSFLIPFFLLYVTLFNHFISLPFYFFHSPIFIYSSSFCYSLLTFFSATLSVCFSLKFKPLSLSLFNNGWHVTNQYLYRIQHVSSISFLTPIYLILGIMVCSDISRCNWV